MKEGIFVTQFLVRTLIHGYEQVEDPKVREKYGLLSSGVGVCLNIILFLVKFTLGTISNSIAVTADAFNNLSDVGSALITFLGFKLASKPADEEHPFGHGRLEYLSGLVLAFVILMVGVEILKSSIAKIFNPSLVKFSAVTIAGLLLSIALKFWMYRFNMALAKKIGSGTMQAAASDSLNDCISSGATTLGVLFAYFLPYPIDGYLGVMAGLFVLYSGYSIVKDTLNPLLGQAPDEALADEINVILRSYSLIVGAHDLVIHDYGPGRIMGSIHAEVPDDVDIREAHDVIDNVERKIASKLKIAFVIHMDPVTTNDPQLEMLRGIIENAVEALDDKMSIHDLRVVRGPSHTNLIFDVAVPNRFTEKNYVIKKAVDQALSGMDTIYYTVISYDRNYL